VPNSKTSGFAFRGVVWALAKPAAPCPKERPLVRSVGDVWEEPTSPPAPAALRLGGPTAKENPGAAKEAPPLPIARSTGNPLTELRCWILIRTPGPWACWSSESRGPGAAAPRKPRGKCHTRRHSAEYDEALPRQFAGPTSHNRLAKRPGTMLSEILKRQVCPEGIRHGNGEAGVSPQIAENGCR